MIQSQEAYDTYGDRLFLQDTAAAPKLRSNLTNTQFLDTISGHGRGGKKRSRPTANDLVEISDDSDDEPGPAATVS